MAGSLRFRPMTEGDLPVVMRWFDDEHFYYDTKEPATLSRAGLEYYLTHPDSAFHLVELDGEPVGLADHMVTESTRYARVDLRLKEGMPAAATVSARAMVRLIGHLVGDSNVRRVERLVYGFDPVGRAVCEAAGMVHEGSLRSAVFKAGRYWPVLVFAARAGQWVEPGPIESVQADPYPIVDRSPVGLRRPPPELTPALVAVALGGWLAGDLPHEWFPVTGAELSDYRERVTAREIRELTAVIEGQPVAAAVIEDLVLEHRRCRLRVGFFNPDWRRSEVSAAVVAAVADYVRDDLGAERSYGTCPAEDEGARAVLQAAGFVQEGTLGRARIHGGQSLDILVAGRPRRGNEQ